MLLIRMAVVPARTPWTLSLCEGTQCTGLMTLEIKNINIPRCAQDWLQKGHISIKKKADSIVLSLITEAVSVVNKQGVQQSWISSVLCGGCFALLAKKDSYSDPCQVTSHAHTRRLPAGSEETSTRRGLWGRRKAVSSEVPPPGARDGRPAHLCLRAPATPSAPGGNGLELPQGKSRCYAKNTDNRGLCSENYFTTSMI